jgi:hypothetical protein
VAGDLVKLAGDIGLECVGNVDVVSADGQFHFLSPVVKSCQANVMQQMVFVKALCCAVGVSIAGAVAALEARTRLRAWPWQMFDLEQKCVARAGFQPVPALVFSLYLHWTIWLAPILRKLPQVSHFEHL